MPNEKDLKRYGFKYNDSQIVRLFLNIPIYPEWIKKTDLLEKCGLDKTKTSKIKQLPVNAPVMEDKFYLSRWV